MYQKVVIIDDLFINCELAKQKLLFNFFALEVVTFTSATDALVYLTETNRFPEIIFLDLHMPVMNGFAFMDEYSEITDDKRGGCGIVIFSSTKSPEDFVRLDNYPFIKLVIDKEITPEVLGLLR